MVVPLMNPATAAYLKAFDEVNMLDTCDIVRVAPGDINPDGSSEPGTITITTVPCRFDDMGGAQELELAMGVIQEMNAIIRVPKGTDATPTDTVMFKGDEYQIVDTNDIQTAGTSMVLTVKLMKQ